MGKVRTTKPRSKAASKQQESKEETNVAESNGIIYPAIICLFGFSIAVVLGYQYSIYAKLLHENDMWFSNIKVLFYILFFTFLQMLYFTSDRNIYLIINRFSNNFLTQSTLQRRNIH